MDFIIKFLKSKNISTNIKYNNILIVIDKLIKYAHLLSYIDIFQAKQTA